jgi:hypothetical protein
MLIVEIMQTRWLWLVCLAGCGGGGTAGTEKQVCEHAAKLCDAQDEIASCGSDLTKVKKVMGDQYGKFLDCSLAAKSCGEYLGCAIGGLGNRTLDELDGFGQGMKKMMKDKLDNVPDRIRDGIDTLHDRVEHQVRKGLDGDLPGPCTRIEKVCSPDEPFIRRGCTKLVGNLGEDKAHLAEVTKCIDASTNCYALEKCVDDMESTMESTKN